MTHWQNAKFCIFALSVILLCVLLAFMDGTGVMEAPLPTLVAGGYPTISLAKPPATFDDLLDAIEWVESKGDANAVCPNGCCVGAYQITEIYVDDCNRIMSLLGVEGDNVYEDRWDKVKSRGMTHIVTLYYSLNDWRNKIFDMMGFLETAARTHKNPSKRNHESTKEYWLKIKKRLDDVG